MLLPRTSSRTTEIGLNITFTLEHVAEVILLVQRISVIAIDYFGVLRKII